MINLYNALLKMLYGIIGTFDTFDTFRVAVENQFVKIHLERNLSLLAKKRKCFC